MYVLRFYTPDNNPLHQINVHIGHNAPIERTVSNSKKLEQLEAINGKNVVMKYNKVYYVSNSRAALVKKANQLRDEYIAELEAKIKKISEIEIK